jgi:hypothetical protein
MVFDIPELGIVGPKRLGDRLLVLVIVLGSFGFSFFVMTKLRLLVHEGEQR